MNPNYQVVWKPVRPEFTIECTRSISSNCYHQSWFTVVSQRALDGEDFRRLDACGLLGSGQAYDLELSGDLKDSVPAVVVDKRTGAVVEGEAPTNYFGDQITRLYDFTYHRYVIRRTCDSGD